MTGKPGKQCCRARESAFDLSRRVVNRAQEVHKQVSPQWRPAGLSVDAHQPRVVGVYSPPRVAGLSPEGGRYCQMTIDTTTAGEGGVK